MSFSEDRFREHLKQVVASQSKDSDRPLTLSELKELAEGMGVSDSEWETLMTKAEVSMATALKHLNVENYTDAIASAEEATALNPYIKDGNAILAQSYYKLGIVDKDDQLFIKSEAYARMELKNDPLDSTALNVLSAIEQIRKEGKYSNKLIKTVGIAIGGILLIFFLMYTCTGNLNEDTVKEIYAEQNSSDNVLTSQRREAKKLEASYIQAIETRNESALEIVGQIKDSQLKKKFTEAVTSFNFERIKHSEQTYRLLLSEVKSSVRIDENSRIILEGSDNRINVAKKRYVVAVTVYNSTLDESSPEGSFKPMKMR
ncbi:MAG: tetratricopeptide (TPR) repeat protein [Flavobacteriaceae bacterium]|jgi:tetratricopeptide (TPR) repeat protein